MDASRRIVREPAFLVVVAVAAVVAAALSWLGIERHERFGSGTDLALFSQAAWLLGHLDEPFLTVHSRHLLGEHFQPAFVLYAPFGLLDETALLVVQAIALTAVGPLLYLLARGRGAGAWLSVLPALLWLLSPLMHNAALFEFHPETLAPALLAGAVVLLDRDRGIWFAALALTAGLLKEDVMVAVCLLGVVVALTGRRRLGLAVAGAAAAIALFALTIAIPHYGDALVGYRRRFGGERGDTLGEVAGWMLSHPGAALGDLFTGTNVALVVTLLVTTAGLALLEPLLLVPAVPGLAHSLLSAYEYQHRFDAHYQVVTAGLVAIAGAAGAARLTSSGRGARLLAAGGATTAALWYLSFVGSAVPENVRAVTSTSDDQRVADRRAAVALVRPNEPVAAPMDIAAHLSQRREAYGLPEPFRPATEYPGWTMGEMADRARDVRVVIYDEGLYERVSARETVRDAYAAIPRVLRRQGFEVEARFGTIVVYRRAGGAAP